jgi:flagellar protein FliS
MHGSGLDTYHRVAVTTQSPEGLVLQLLEGAIRFLRQGMHALDHRDIARFAHAESRAHAIVAELRRSLDHEVGGELAASLDRLYDFMLRHLVQGLATRDRTALAEVAALLQTVRDGFAAVVEHGRPGPAGLPT